jgi:antitoxin MazE
MSSRLTANKSLVKNGKVARWGNSLGLRIPREAVDRLNLKDGADVSLEIGPNSVIIRPTRLRKKWTEAELLKGVTPEMIKGEIDWGGPVGKEVL